jgi:hypothetical protein
VLLPWTCTLQPPLVHLRQTSSLLPGSHPIVASTSLRLFYLLLYSEHIKHIQVLGFLPLVLWPMQVLPLVCEPCPVILLHLFRYIIHIWGGTCDFFGLLSLANFKMMCSSSIYLLVNNKISFFFVNK